MRCGVAESAAEWTAAECSRLVRVVLIAAWAAARSALDTLGSRATWRRHASCHSWSRPAPPPAPALLTGSPSSLLQQSSFLQTRFTFVSTLFRSYSYNIVYLYQSQIIKKFVDFCCLVKDKRQHKHNDLIQPSVLFKQFYFIMVGTQRFIKIELGEFIL